MDYNPDFKPSLIPWDSTNGSSTGTTDNPTSKYLFHLCNLFDTDTNQQLAYKTILGELQRRRLCWHKESSSSPVVDLPVPPWWDIFVKNALRAIMITGCFVYRVVEPVSGIPMCLVAPVHEVWTVWSSKLNKYVPSKLKKGWKCVVVEPPLRISSCSQTISDPRLFFSSGSVRAEPHTLKFQALLENWCKRDHNNSVPTIYTSVSDQLRQQGGSDRPWYRGVPTSEAVPLRSQDIDRNFNALVHRRAEVIAKLDAITSMSRARQDTVAGESEDKCGSSSQPDHREHVVSDGRVYTESRPLTDLPTLAAMSNQLLQNILFSFGVPPQALGKNINSERLASSNRLTEMAILTYQTYVIELRRTISSVVKKESVVDSHYIDLHEAALSHFELEQVSSFLTPSACRMLTASTFNIPESYIDPDLLEQRRSLQADQDSSSNKNANTSPITEQESVQRKRARAAVPNHH